MHSDDHTIEQGTGFLPERGEEQNAMWGPQMVHARMRMHVPLLAAAGAGGCYTASLLKLATVGQASCARLPVLQSRPRVYVSACM